MKRFTMGLAAVCLAGALQAGAQDAATVEHLNRLSGQIQDVLAAQESQRKQISELMREIAALRERQDRPGPNFASQEALNRLADSVREIDRKRIEDYEKIRSELLKLGRTLADTSSAATRKSAPVERAVDEKGFEYEVQPGDTLTTIVSAVRRQKNIKVTTESVLKANPGLKADRLIVGKKIFIPSSESKQ